jgi:hypothetical protein
MQSDRTTVINLLIDAENNKIFEDCKKSAVAGDAKAQNNLGNRYSYGVNVPIDHKEAFKWHLLAAEQGHVDSQRQIGCAYEWGFGVEKNNKKAEEWYHKAAEQGCAQSQERLKNHYHKETPRDRGDTLEREAKLAVEERLRRRQREKAILEAIQTLARQPESTLLKVSCVLNYVAYSPSTSSSAMPLLTLKSLVDMLLIKKMQIEVTSSSTQASTSSQVSLAGSSSAIFSSSTSSTVSTNLRKKVDETHPPGFTQS